MKLKKWIINICRRSVLYVEDAIFFLYPPLFALTSIVIIYTAYDYLFNIRPIIYKAGIRAGLVNGMTIEKFTEIEAQKEAQRKVREDNCSKIQ